MLKRNNHFFRPLAMSAIVMTSILFCPASSADTAVEKPGDIVNGLAKADREKIQRVIKLQIWAFERNDEAVAFAYVSPGTHTVWRAARCHESGAQGLRDID